MRAHLCLPSSWEHEGPPCPLPVVEHNVARLGFSVCCVIYSPCLVTDRDGLTRTSAYPGRVWSGEGFSQSLTWPQAMTGELEKAIRDGKSVIFEGSCMEPRATMQRVQRLLATFNESPATARGAPAPVFVPCLLVAPPGRFAADPGMCEMLRHLDAQCSEMGMSRVVVDDEDPQGALDALHEQWLDALLRAL